MRRSRRSNRSPITIATVVAGVTLAASLALAHGGATGIVKERMDLMDGIGKAMKTLSSIFKGEVEYDPEAVKAAAADIRDHAGEKITALFPEGSLDKPSEALPTIWQDWAAFEALAHRLADYSDALVQAADNSPAEGGGMMGQGMMGQGQGMMGQGQGMMGQGQGMMGQGQGMMMHGSGGPPAEMLAQMPPQAAFGHLAQTCNACHTRFRVKKN